jgi:hypothetical protein
MSSILPDQYESKCGGWGWLWGLRLSANEFSCVHHVTWSPNKLWRSNTIFNQLLSLCVCRYSKLRKKRTYEHDSVMEAVQMSIENLRQGTL